MKCKGYEVEIKPVRDWYCMYITVPYVEGCENLGTYFKDLGNGKCILGEDTMKSWVTDYKDLDLLYSLVNNLIQSYEELVSYVQKTVNHLCHGFTVDDLFFLHKGGRISKSTAILGTAINIKPILHVDNEGHLINIDKVRGRKKAISKLVDFVEEKIVGYEDKNQTVAICHGDCIEDAKYLESLLIEKFNFKNIVISYTGTVIGAHSGPGTLAVFFEGREK